MISSGCPPDSGTCRALSECFGDKNIELAADLVEAAEAERVEFLLLSRSGGGGAGGPRLTFLLLPPLPSLPRSSSTSTACPARRRASSFS